MRRFQRILSSLLLLLAVTLPFQNCSSALDFAGSSSSRATQDGGGNGDGYQGKPTIYDHYSSANPCPETGADGRALPNDQIFVFTLGAQKTRTACADIEPVALDMSQIAFSRDRSTLTFQGETFASRPAETDFKVVRASCPSTMSPIANASRTNLFADSQDLNGASWSYAHGGTSAALHGSFLGLPSFLVSRPQTLPADQWWKRPSKLVTVPGGKKYAFSFLAAPGSVSVIRFNIWQYQGTDIALEVDLTTGALTQLPTPGTGSYTYDITPKGDGQFVTIYFDAINGNELDIGVSPWTTNQGDSINTTAYQLESVESFCQ